MNFPTQCYINGEWLGGEDYPVLNPATSEILAKVPYFGATETQQAISAANDALPAWSGLLAKERSNILRKWFNLIIEHKEALAVVLTKEQGKPLFEALGEIEYGANFVEFYAEEAKRLNGFTLQSHKLSAKTLVFRQALGVVAAITPWNFPSAMITRKIAPALAVGCTVIVKPAQETPLSALALVYLAEKAGIPKGVINVITGNPAEIGQTLCASPIVRGLSFTGSTAVGKLLMRQCADTVKKISLELGGNAAFIVFDDADINIAVKGAIAAKFRNAGQTCVCANRIYVQSGIYDIFAAAMVKEVQNLKLGNGLDIGTTQGPLINTKAIEKVQEHIADALSKGAKLAFGNEKLNNTKGTFFNPTILTHVDHSMKVATEETFGPVAPLFMFESEDEVIKAANATEFGLASYVYTKNLGRAFRMANALEVGMVGINEGVISTELAPFGGIKQSGIGREGSHIGLEEFTEYKYVMMGGLES